MRVAPAPRAAACGVSFVVLLVILVGASGNAAGFMPASQSARQTPRECFILARPDRPPQVSDARECAVATAPASTFKVPHALIALQTGVVTPETVVTYDGTPRAFEAWKRDHTIVSAIPWSVYPFFQHTARLIGRERMIRSLRSLHYAADTFERELTTFWNDGDLVVTPLEQTAFLRRFADGALPIDARHVAVVKDAMRMPPGQIVSASGPAPFALDWPAGTIVRAKTGNTTVNGERVSWLIGLIDADGVTSVFAGRSRAAGELDRSAGSDVARRGLNDARH